MKFYTDLQGPSRDLNAFLRSNWAKLPSAVQEEVSKFDGPGNEQDRNAYIVECMYANRNKPGVKNNAAREIMAGIALYYGTVLGILYFKDGRGERMANALRRDMGEEGFTQPVADDPEPLPQYVEQPTDVAPPATPPAA
jgi:hypothetical protein